MNKFASFPLHPSYPPVDGFGGKIAAQAELALSAARGTFYVVEGNATIKRIAPLQPGAQITLLFLGSPQIVLSSYLLYPGASSSTIQAAPGQAMTFLALENGVWQAINVPTNVTTLESRAAIAMLTVGTNASLTYIRTAGYYAVGDGGGALYKRVSSAPSHAGKVQSADGIWFEYVQEGSANWRQFGAKGDGTDDTTPAQNAINYLQTSAVTGGTLYTTAGFFLLSGGITTIDSIRIIGAGINGTVLFCGAADVNVVTLGSSHSWIEHLSIYGKGSNFGAAETFGATKSALKLSGHANNLRVWYGYYALEITGTDCTIHNVNAANAYGPANVYTTGANWYVRNIFDHSATGIGISGSPPYAARANTTAYTLGQVRSLSGYLIQCSVAGTSGGSPPSLKNYGAPIIDGTVTWLLLAPVDFAGCRIATGAGENHFVQTDFTGAGYAHSIVVDAAGGSYTNLTDCVLNSTVDLVAGTTCTIRGCTLGGDINVSAPFGVTIVDGNVALAVLTVALAANTSNFFITNNHFSGCSITVAAGTSDNYTISGNGGPPTITDGGTGTNKILQTASTTAKGPVELATDAETKALADTQRAVTPSNLAALLTQPTTQTFLAGSGTYTKPANVLSIEIHLVGGGGGGGGSGSGAGNGTAGGNTTFGTLTGTGGSAGSTSSAAVVVGGAASGGIINQVGGGANGADGTVPNRGAAGGNSFYGGGGAGGGVAGAGVGAAVNSGSGGGGGGATTANAGGGGAAGGYVYHIINAPAATYSYSVGAAGTAGSAGTGGAAGGTGSNGRITVIEHYV
jgi:hypothetical protein